MMTVWHNRSTVLFLCCLICLLSGPRAHADPTAPTQDDGEKRIVTVPIADAPAYAKRALVIGVDAYENVQPLSVCAADAHAFADLLRTKFGFQTVTLMTDEPATPESLTPTYLHIKRQLEVLSDSIVAGQTQIVLFYSGHGVRHQNAAGADADYIVPLDGDPDDITGTCIDYTAFKNDLDTRQPARALLVMDACRNLLGGKSVAGGEFGAVRTVMGPQIAELLSCQPTQVSREGLPKDFSESVFTHYLIQGLSGDKGAVDPDKNVVTFDSLKLFVQGEVSDYVAHNFSATQVPDGEATFGGMVLAKWTQDSPPLTSRSAASPFVAPEQQAAADARLTALWTDLCGRFNLDKARSMSIVDVSQALDAGADVNARDVGGKDTSLMAAVISGRLDVAKLLVEAGADVHAKENNQTTIIYLAADHDNADVVKVLLAAGAGADINIETTDGMTPLMRAAEYNRADIVIALLAAGADTYLVDEQHGGMTALWWAINKYGYEGVIKPLLDAGAVKDQATLNKCLIAAAAHGKEPVVKLLLDSGADKNATDTNGHSVLWWANHPSSRDFMVTKDDAGATVAELQGAGAKE